MKSFLYWAGASILVVTLLATVFVTADFIQSKHWPFHEVWGGGIALLGIAVAVTGRAFPAKLWGIPRNASLPDATLLREAARVAAVFGALIVLSGGAYALTGKVGVLIGAWIVAGVYARIGMNRLRPSPDGRDS